MTWCEAVREMALKETDGKNREETGQDRKTGGLRGKQA
jgi:hypothetical protein